jgi:hypothetical protein
MSPGTSFGSRSRRPYASSKNALPSSAVRNTNVDVWKTGHLDRALREVGIIAVAHHERLGPELLVSDPSVPVSLLVVIVCSRSVPMGFAGKA